MTAISLRACATETPSASRANTRSDRPLRSDRRGSSASGTQSSAWVCQNGAEQNWRGIYPDDGERLAVQLDAPSDDPGVPTESPYPQAVRDHDDVASPRFVVSGLDGTSHFRADAEDVEQGARYLERRDALGAPVRREVGAPRLRSSHAGEAMRLLTEVEVVGR
jgi:hypothetical protein